MFAHLLTLDATFFDTHRVGELTSRLNGDVATIRGAVGSSFSLALRSMVTIIGALVMMFLTSPYLTLAVVVVAPAILFPVIIFARRLRGMSRRTQDALADLSAMATEMLGATRTVKSFTQEPVQSRHLRRAQPRPAIEAEVERLLARARCWSAWSSSWARRRWWSWSGGAPARCSRARSRPASWRSSWSMR